MLHTMTARRPLAFLVLVVATEGALTIAHFAHGATVYEDPSRLHIVTPALAAVGVVVALSAAYAIRPSSILRWLVALSVTVPFICTFGLYHGGFEHVLKLALFATGTSPERLLAIFDSPDFAVPNDAMFEASGVLTFVVAAVVTHHLARFMRDTRSV
jgi:hypothetical protein